MDERTDFPERRRSAKGGDVAFGIKTLQPGENAQVDQHSIRFVQGREGMPRTRAANWPDRGAHGCRELDLTPRRNDFSGLADHPARPVRPFAADDFHWPALPLPRG